MRWQHIALVTALIGGLAVLSRGDGAASGVPIDGRDALSEPPARVPTRVPRPSIPARKARPIEVPAAAPASTDDDHVSREQWWRDMRAGIESSGASSGPWTGHAHALLDRWRANASVELRDLVHFGPMTCFRDGCVVDAHYADHGAFAAVDESLPRSQPFLELPGSKHRAPPRPSASGGITATWIFKAPTPTTEGRKST